MSYIEINNEQGYDLLFEGDQILDLEGAEWTTMTSIEDILESKQRAETF